MGKGKIDDDCRQGAARIESGDLDGALESFSKALAANPGLAEAYCWRSIARIRHDKEGRDAAIADLERAIGILAGNGVGMGAEDGNGAGSGCVAVQEMFARIFADVPDEIWQRLPDDLSRRHDFYINEDGSE